MMKSNKLAILAALLSLLMLVSMLVVPAFAAEDGSSADASTTDAATEPATDGETGTGSATTGATTTGSSTAGSSTTAASTTAADTSEEAKQKEQMTRGLINLGVGVVILIALAVLGIKFRDKIPTWFKALKSECGKVTWCPKDKLKKNTIVVVIIILAITAVIAILDFTFSSGVALLGLIGK